MAMSDEAMFAPPQGITIEAVNGMLAERLAQKHGKASLLRAFIPLPPPFSPVQLIELHVLKSNFYYRYHDDGSDVTATTEYQGEGNDSNLLIVFYVQIMPDDFVMQLHRF
ncbi:2-component regulator [Escherichia coli]|nr:2-component regulator [Escherichia coli]